MKRNSARRLGVAGELVRGLGRSMTLSKRLRIAAVLVSAAVLATGCAGPEQYVGMQIKSVAYDKRCRESMAVCRDSMEKLSFEYSYHAAGEATYELTGEAIWRGGPVVTHLTATRLEFYAVRHGEVIAAGTAHLAGPLHKPIPFSTVLSTAQKPDYVFFGSGEWKAVERW